MDTFILLLIPVILAVLFIVVAFAMEVRTEGHGPRKAL
jgi:hypothetical protein